VQEPIVVELDLESVLLENASLSPDGRFVAYDSPTDTKTQERDIFVLATDGSLETRVVQSPADDVEPVWSPDGSRILFLSDRTGTISLWSVSIENGSPTGPAELVKADMGRLESMAMSRNGTLYYVIPGTSSPNIYSAELGPDMKVSKPPVLAVERFVNSNNGPSLSPDGQYLAYDSFHPGGTALVVRALKTGEEREVPSQVRVGMIFGYGPMWFPDGRSLLVLSRDSQRPGFSFHQVEVETGKAEMLLHTDRGLQGYKLSPDGKTIFFTEVTPSSSGKTVTTRLLRFDLGTRRETELKKGEFFIAVAVSPDSKQLAYLVQDVGAQRSSSYLAVMPAEGGEAREIFRGTPWLDGSRYNTLAWTPDQRYLLFVRASVGDNGPSVLWRVPIAGGPAEQMGISMLARIKSPQIHPDLRRIFFSVNPNSPSEVWALQNFLPKTGAK
jgi:Tol biopolymer transport system component